MTPLRTCILLLALTSTCFFSACAQHDSFYGLYVAECATCHGDGFEGTSRGPALASATPTAMGTQESIITAITNGKPEMGMPAFGETLDANQIKRLAILIAEVQLAGVKDGDYYNVKDAFSLPEAPLQTEHHTFSVQSVATNLDPLPYSIAPLPDGRILVTEKLHGLRIVEKDGSLSPLIAGTPETNSEVYEDPSLFIKYGGGWMLDVALHPDYATNGWIYLTYGDRCSNCNYLSRTSGSDVSMLKLIRGRIADDQWIDEETIWQADSTWYTPTPDITLGGRMAFDGSDYLYFTVGMKGIANYMGIQELNQPAGKIHRIHLDGSIPADNPFVGDEKAVQSIWSYGHRSPQGLEFNPRTRQLWGTEMGPRGGDEVNLIDAGKNYGWPLHSLGLDYDGSPVEYGELLGITVDLTEIEQPKVDLTPSPAVSSFIIHDGSAFPEWKDNLLVGSLKATELYRMVVEGDEVVHQETIISDLARIRDIEHGADGTIYLLLEHDTGGHIVKLVNE